MHKNWQGIQLRFLQQSKRGTPKVRREFPEGVRRIWCFIRLPPAVQPQPAQSRSLAVLARGTRVDPHNVLQLAFSAQRIETLALDRVGVCNGDTGIIGVTSCKVWARRYESRLNASRKPPRNNRFQGQQVCIKGARGQRFIKSSAPSDAWCTRYSARLLAW